ncbi:MAG: replicative DNA helicase [Candidatus Kapaibacterium sp.]
MSTAIHTLVPDRVPPHSKEAEMSVLGAIMLAPEAISRVMQILQPDAFYYESHRVIYEAASALSDRTQPIDIITLNDELRRMGKLADVGGSHYLSELNMRTATAANVEFHARIVAERAMKRRIISVAAGMTAAAYAEESDAFEVMEAAQRAVATVAEQRIGGTAFRSIHDIAIEAFEEIEQNVHLYRAGTPVGVTTGFLTLDQATGGLRGSELIILAARPAMGKTSLMMGMMRGAARAGRKAVGISLEMSARQLVTRGLAEDMGIDVQALRRGTLTDAEMRRLGEVMRRFTDQTIWLDDHPAQTIQQIRARARVQRDRYGLDILFVDYLQLASGESEGRRNDNREREIATISRGLKQLAKELDIPIVALSQLNRSVESRGDKRPMLSDLRESGAIEQDADVVMFLHRPDYYGITTYEDGALTEGTAEIIIGKQRNGDTGTRRLAFIREQCAFKDLAHQYPTPAHLQERDSRTYGNEPPF